MKAFKQVDGDEVITLQWASDTAASHLKLVKGYLDELVKEGDPVKRSKLANKADEAVTKIVITSEMVGVLGDDDTMIAQFFNGADVEIVDWEPVANISDSIVEDRSDRKEDV